MGSSLPDLEAAQQGLLGLDAVAFFYSVGAFGIAVLLASAQPARRAARVAPAEVLRDA